MRRMLLLVAAVAFAAGATAYAHHSYAATYDVSKEVKLEGKVVQFVLRNPHSFVHIQTKGDKGASQRWSVEWSGTTQLGNQGVTQQSLKVGDEVVGGSGQQLADYQRAETARWPAVIRAAGVKVN